MNGPVSRVGQTDMTMPPLASKVCEVGPAINSIATALGENKEMLRYRYNRYILGNRMSVHAVPNYRRLGLSRALVVASFPPEAPSNIWLKDLFNRVAEQNYIMSFERAIQDGYNLPPREWLFSIAYPKGRDGELSYYLNRLIRTGILSKALLHTFDKFDVIAMRADCYDFMVNRWNVRLDNERPSDDHIIDQECTERCEFDKVDLMIIKALQADANTNLSDIHVPNVSYKTLTWHWREHVTKRGMIDGYRINWLSSGYNQSTGLASRHQFRYQRIDLLVKNTSTTERQELAHWAHKIPFLWLEAVGTDYYAKLAVPVEITNEFNGFLRAMTERVSGRARIMLMDQASAFSYAINPDLYMPSEYAWVFNGKKLEAAASKITPTYKARA